MPLPFTRGTISALAYGLFGGKTVTASYLVVAGGGGGSSNGGYSGAGGGAGGMRTGSLTLDLTQSFAVTVGAGGGPITNGSNSVFSSITSIGGGAASSALVPPGSVGSSGGSGGGGSFGQIGGAGTAGQGNNGGASVNIANVGAWAGGGGGAGAVGSDGANGVAGNGGNGSASSISGTSVTYAGGGGSAGQYPLGTGSNGTGGTGGGGAGVYNGVGGFGTANTGGGGGAGTTGGQGGSGIVIISYPGAQQFGGGIVTSSGGNTIHTFTTSGTLSPLNSLTSSYLIVAGGGGGGYDIGAGGGAGGLLAGSNLTIDTNSVYVVTVGAGGTRATSAVVGSNGTNSSFSVYSTSAVGGGGGASNGSPYTGNSGGSGGGGAISGTGGAGTAGQGFAGGNAGGGIGGGGGGGASAAGANGTAIQAGKGGDGAASSISGSSVTYAGGGGAGGYAAVSLVAGAGGAGGGGAGGGTGAAGTAGTANTGGGGGTGGQGVAGGGNGGSGIVIISYPGSAAQMAGGTITVAGGNVIHTFTSSGFLTPITNLTNSLRFRSSASAYLNRTSTVAGNRKTWTWSGWVKRGSLSSYQALFNGTQVSLSGYADGLILTDTNTFYLSLTTSGLNAEEASISTTQVFRDPSAWYHIVVAVDTTQATASNRIKIYVNGSQVTAFASATYPSQNFDCIYIGNSGVYQIGRSNSTWYFDGYLADVNFIDGQALTPNAFGALNDLGVWQPIRYGGSYGTNGFYLPFTNTTSTTTLGYDFSPNGNNWTTNNISLTAGSTYDAMTDVPTNTSATAANYAVMNPLDKDTARGTIDNGNLRLTYPAYNAVNAAAVRGTIGVSSGKWYFEFSTITWNGIGNSTPGYITSSTQSLTGISAFAGSLSNFIGATADVSANNVFFLTAGLSASLATSTTLFSGCVSGDVIGVAFDLDLGRIWISKNGTWYNSGNPATNTNPTATFTTSGAVFFPAFEAITSASNANQSSNSPNFGQRPFAYTPPSGFVALNTFNLPTPTIGATAATQAGLYMNVGLYTGTGSATALPVSGPNTPDFVWIKGRSAATSHSLLDKLRDSADPFSLRLYSNATNAEYDYGSSLLTPTSTGFNLTTTDADHNTNGATYVAWQWKANGAGSTNTAGSITSTVSANTTAGFSVVTYTGTGANGTVGHGLGVAPKMIICKSRTNAYEWIVWHTGLTSAAYYVNLNTTNAQATASTLFQSTAPSSSVITLGTNITVNASGANQLIYCFAEVAGYSRFGSYTGNGSTDGPFIFTGFRPKFVIFKSSTVAATGWYMFDTSRTVNNVMGDYLESQLANAEANFAFGDFLSNGFKMRNTNAGFNSNGETYIYMAFAESPFKYANAR